MRLFSIILLIYSFFFTAHLFARNTGPKCQARKLKELSLKKLCAEFTTCQSQSSALSDNQKKAMMMDLRQRSDKLSKEKLNLIAMLPEAEFTEERMFQDCFNAYTTRPKTDRPLYSTVKREHLQKITEFVLKNNFYSEDVENHCIAKDSQYPNYQGDVNAIIACVKYRIMLGKSKIPISAKNGYSLQNKLDELAQEKLKNPNILNSVDIAYDIFKYEERAQASQQ